MNITFKEIIDTNTDYIWHTYVNAMKLHISKIWGWDLGWQKVEFDKALIKYETYILQIDNMNIGYVQFKISTIRTYLNMIILDSQNQSKGYGQEIISKIHSLNPLKPLELRCFKINRPAYNFYQKNGFEVIDKDQFFILMRLKELE